MLKGKAREKLASANLHKSLQMLNYVMDFGKRLKDVMEQRGVKPKELADSIDVDPSFISQLRSGHRKPGRDVLTKLSRALNVKIEALISQNNVERVEFPAGRIPLISWVQAGEWSEAIDSYPPGVAEDWIPYGTKDRSTFALRVKGDSMEPEYRDGDVTIVNPSIEARPGDDIVAKCGQDVTFKRLKKHGATILLSPLNPSYPDIIITGKDLKNYRSIGVIESLIRTRRKKKK